MVKRDPSSTYTALSNRIIKVNHAGEFGAVNIYRAQILVGRLLRSSYVPLLLELVEHEKVHLATFGALLGERAVRRCRSYWLCGIGGWFLGFVTSLLGRRGVMACTAAVETVVLGHLHKQLQYLGPYDAEAHAAVLSIIADEEAHRDVGEAEGGNSIWYRPVRVVVAHATEFVIWLGMKI